MKVIGIKKISYNKKDGTHIEGTNLFCTYKDNNTEGLACENVFCSSRVSVGHVKVGCEINVYYNKFGKPDIIQVVS